MLAMHLHPTNHSPEPHASCLPHSTPLCCLLRHCSRSNTVMQQRADMHVQLLVQTVAAQRLFLACRHSQALKHQHATIALSWVHVRDLPQ